jgi:serine-type D-Ala-D-Ala carboxypeptidase
VKALNELLAQGVRDGVFLQARAEVWQHGHFLYSGGNASAQAIFDLASLTKVMCTTALILERRIPLLTKIREWIPFGPLEATVEDLLFHRSGLPAFVPFFADEINLEPTLLDGFCRAGLRAQVRRKVLARACSTPPERAVGSSAVYSDVGFLVLTQILESDSKSSLDVLFNNHVATPLGLAAHFKILSHPAHTRLNSLETGTLRPRPWAPGQEGPWQTPQKIDAAVSGAVDDDNAFVMDGVAGHAGLFSTARDVAQFGQAILSGALMSPIPWRRDSKLSRSTRALGFDTPSDIGASCGPRFGRAGPLGAVGHLGFTGTSLWIDFDRQLVVVLLTNRVALGRDNLKIRDFRPRFHEAVIEELEPV